MIFYFFEFQNQAEMALLRYQVTHLKQMLRAHQDCDVTRRQVMVLMQFQAAKAMAEKRAQIQAGMYCLVREENYTNILSFI